MQIFRKIAAVSIILFGMTNQAMAAVVDIPGAADAGRVQSDIERRNIQLDQDTDPVTPNQAPLQDAPEESKSIKFVLKDVKVEGMTVFNKSDVEGFYKDYLNREITLDVMWVISNKITALYRDKGYFLSRAYVPQQEIENGVVTIRVVEGFAGNVEIEGEYKDSRLVNEAVRNITSEKPLKLETMERNILLLNDLAGVNFRAVLKVLEGKEGQVLLSLVPEKEDNSYRLSYDNYGSRYLGPYSALATADVSLLPFQKTSLAASVTTPADELKYYSLKHEVPVFTDLVLDVYGSYTDAEPGYELKQTEVESDSIGLGLALQYKAIRQRQENLNLSLTVEGRNTNTDVLQTAQTRDRIRSARFGVNYDKVDNWNGFNNLNFIYSKGLDIFGASQAGELTLSRAGAEPDFDKAELYISRLQSVSQNFAVALAAGGQYSNEPLYSSEEFGYGGQGFGRAYDSSEITGDSGVAGSVELRYYTDPIWEITTMPYVFYDIGKVWNEDAGGQSFSASSAGLGLRFGFPSGFSANVAMAQPLTKELDAPQTSNDKAPRFLFQLSYGL